MAAFRNLLHHVVHQRSAGDVESFWAGIGAVRANALRRRRRIRRGPLPAAVDRGHRARWPAGPAGPDPPRPGDPGHAPQGVVARVDGPHRFRTPRSSVGQPARLDRRELPATLNLGARERASVLAALVVAWGIVRRRPLVVAAGVGAEVALNRDLLALLHERLGPARRDRRRRPAHGAPADGGCRRAGRPARVGLAALDARAVATASAASIGFRSSLSSRYSASALTAHTSLSAPSRRFSVPSTAVHIEWSWLL